MRSNEDFANTLSDTRLDNIDSEHDIADTEEIYTPHAKQMAQIRDIITNMLRKNQNSQ